MQTEIDFTTRDGLVAGVDEAGRGPWAGPVVTAAVILPQDHTLVGLGDSKKLSAPQREHLYDQIWAQAMVGVAASSVQRIGEMNILGATLDAMRRAVQRLPQAPASVLVDGNRVPPLPMPARAVVKGDALIPAISAASIIAKVLRDRIMTTLATRYPVYGWETNAGYGVPKHKAGLANYGVTPHHRITFTPVRKILTQQENIAD